MIDLFRQAGIEIDGEQAEKFRLYSELLREYNERFNLTAITDEREIIVKHFVDSAIGAKYLPLNATVGDVGSGAGFPSFPLKIVRPDVTVTALDSLAKRVGFLKTVAGELKLDGTECVHIRAEDAGRGVYREKFSVVTARAVAPLSTLAEYCLPLVEKGGIFLAYKGSDCEEETRNSLSALRILGGETERIDQFTLPDGSARTIIVIRKLSPTPAKYPRGQNKPRTNPL